MKANEARGLHTDELHAQIAELKEELFNLRFQLATGQLDNHRRIRQVKREVARARTVLRERDFAAASAPQDQPSPQEEAPAEMATGGGEESQE